MREILTTKTTNILDFIAIAIVIVIGMLIALSGVYVMETPPYDIMTTPLGITCLIFGVSMMQFGLILYNAKQIEKIIKKQSKEKVVCSACGTGME